MKGFDSKWFDEFNRRRGGSHKHPAWSKEEDQTLVEFYSSFPIDEDFKLEPLIKKLSRSHHAIVCRAGELGVSFDPGKRPRKPLEERQSKAVFSPCERKVAASVRTSIWHSEHPHPMTGRPVTNETRNLISEANKGRKVSNEEIFKRLRARAANGTMAPNHNGRPWKAGWRVIGGKRIYARSRWEANYARYLEFLKSHSSILEWEHEPETFWFETIRRGCRSYLPDFRVTFGGGGIEYHEVKGWMDSRSKTKIRRMAKYHPNVILKVFDSKWFAANQNKLRILIPDWENNHRNRI